MDAILHTLSTTLTLLIVLSILVVAHEWGHFIVARLFGIRVDDFSIGFGKRIVRLGKRGDTEYNLRMLPLGGFVKIAGMEPDEAPLVHAKEKITGKSEGDDPDSHQVPLVAENTATGEAYHGPDSFTSKPLWQRSLVILAGPVMSFVAGWIVFCLTGFLAGVPTGKMLNQVQQVQPGGEGQRIGLRAGDVIQAIDGVRITDGRQMMQMIHGGLGKTLTLTVQRQNQTLTLKGSPRAKKNDDGKDDLLVDVTTPGGLSALGLQPGDTLHLVNDTEVNTAEDAQNALKKSAGHVVDIVVDRDFDVKTLHGPIPTDIASSLPTLNAHTYGVFNFNPDSEVKRVGLWESIQIGTHATGAFFVQMGQLVSHGQLRKSTGGIIAIYTATGLAMHSQWLFKTLNLMGSLSLSLALFNILPIPILDGGHLLSFLIEGARGGRKMTPAQQQAFLLTGLAVIGVLFVFIMGNDILKVIRHQMPQ